MKGVIVPSIIGAELEPVWILVRVERRVVW
jgi:hypothetical protein